MNLLANWLTEHFELSRGAGHNVRSMEGLRGFAVFLVFLVHYVTLLEPWLQDDSIIMMFASSLRTIGNVGVDLFFVLSGYLIYGSLISRRQSFLKFMKRRIQRIYPSFFVVFVIYLGLSFVFSSESKIPVRLPEATIYLLQNLFLLPGLFAIEPMITVAWSLSYEMFYYLILPLLIAALFLRDWQSRNRIVLFLAITLLIVLIGILTGSYVRLMMFVAGILLYEVMAGDLIRPPVDKIGITALITGLLFMLLPISGSAGFALKMMVLFGAFFILCHICFVNQDSRLTRTFSFAPIRWLGNMSYSYYLIHGLALKGMFLVFAILFPPSATGGMIFWLLFPPMFIGTLVISATLFLLVERPFSLRSVVAR